MRKSVKKWTMFALAALSVGCLGAGVSQAYTASANDVVETFAMESGAGIRLNADSTGIRFIAETNVVDTNATYNFVIAPTYYFEEVKAAEGETDWVAAFDAHEQINYYIHLKNIVPKNADKDANIEIRGSVKDLKFKNMNLEYTGIAYKEVNGVRTYASFASLDDISRSVTNVSSRALNSGDTFTESQIGTMNDFIKKGFLLADGYTETVQGETVTYKKGEGEALELNAAYTAVAPTLSFGELGNQKLLHKTAVSATVSGDVDLAVTYSTDNEKNLVYADGKLQALTTEGGTLTAKAGILTATVDVEVDDVTKREATTDTIVDTTNGSLTTGTGLDLSDVATVYDVTEAPVDMQYASGKVTTTALGERTYAVLTEDNTYYIDVVVSDCVLKTMADYRYYMSGRSAEQTTNGVAATITNTSANAMYAILAANIEGPYSGSGTYASRSRTLRPQGSVFDGRGYSVAGVYMYDGVFGWRDQTKVTLKNITIDNMTMWEGGLLGKAFTDSTLENVTVTCLVDKTTFANNPYMMGTTFTRCTLNNVTVVMYMAEASDTTALNALSSTPDSTFNNVNVYTNNAISGGDVSGLKEGSTYTFIAGKDISATAKEYAVLADATKLESSDLGDIGTVEFLCVGGRLLRPTTGSTFASSLLGEATLIKTTKGVYEVVLADYAITDAETCANFFRARSPYAGARSTAMYAVVSPADGTDTIDASKAASKNWKETNPPKNAVFNGLGNTIANAYFESGLFDNQSQGTSWYTMKNVTFSGMDVYNYCAMGYSLKDMTFENVHISFDISANTPILTTVDKSHNLFARYCTRVTMTNCSISYNMINATDVLARFVMTSTSEQPEHSLTLINTQITSNGLMIKVGEEDTRFTEKPLVKGTVTMDATSYIKDKEDA